MGKSFYEIAASNAVIARWFFNLKALKSSLISRRTRYGNAITAIPVRGLIITAVESGFLVEIETIYS
jgi:hypothetical protein